MKYAFCFFITGILLFCSCNSEDNYKIDSQEDSKVISFSLKDKNGSIYSSFDITDSTICVLCGGGNLDSLLIGFECNGSRVFLDETPIKSNKCEADFSDFCKPHLLRVESSNGNNKDYRIVIFDLPVLIVNTPDSQPILSKDVRVENCTINMIDTNGEVYSYGTAGIRGRGNATWYKKDLLKRPYNIKFDKKQSLFGLPKSKHWILLANAYWDRTQIHNSTAFELARLTDYPWVPSGRFIELFLNGEHLGLYYICEKICLQKGRIDIDEIGPDDIEGEALTGGYLLETVNTTERDDYYVTDYINTTGNPYYPSEKLGWEIKVPDDDAKMEQIKYIKERQSHMEKMIMEPDSLFSGVYRKYFDIESAINWFLIQEAAINVEAWATRNVFMYKPRGDERFYIGPPWDFDAYSFGDSPDYPPGSFSCIYTSLYYKYLFRDSFFIERLKQKWNSIKEVWKEKIPLFIDRQYDEIHRSAERNEIMFPHWLYPNGNYNSKIMEMRENFLDEIDWLDGIIQNLQPIE